jgi:DMSO/TMAO reductase YedYZ molybdopterin-dependent catalytic subunit
MKAIFRTLGLLLLLGYLTGCDQHSGEVSLPSETMPAPTLTRGATAPPYETPETSSTSAPTSTQPAESGPSSSRIEPGGSISAQLAMLTPGDCELKAITQPPQPVKTYLPNEFDAEFGLHITGKYQWIDLEDYHLLVTGLVDHPLNLTYAELRCMPSVTDNPDLKCPGVFTDYASWTGVPIIYILDLAGVQQGAKNLTLVSADGYQVKIPLATASHTKNFLAYEVNGATLPVQHGFPLRAVFPDMWGSYWIKWLVEIRIS